MMLCAEPEKPNAPSLDQQQQIDLRREYAAVLEGLRPEEHEEMPGIDTPWYVASTQQNLDVAIVALVPC